MLSLGRYLPRLALVLAMLLWSSAFIVLKNLLAVWGPGQVIFGRMLVASLCFVLLWRYWRRIGYLRGDWRWFVAMGLAEPCLYFLFEAHALNYTSAGQAGMITATLPLLVSVTAFLFLGERINYRQLSGFLIALAGVVTLTWSGERSAAAPCAWLGNLLEFGAMLCASGYVIALKHLSSRYSPLFLTALQAFTGVLFFAPLALLEPLPSVVGMPQWLSLLYLGACVTLGAYLLNNWAITRLPVTQASAYSNLIPVFTLFLAYWWLGETMTSLQLLASGVVLLGVIISQQPARRRTMAPVVVHEI